MGGGLLSLTLLKDAHTGQPVIWFADAFIGVWLAYQARPLWKYLLLCYFAGLLLLFWLTGNTLPAATLSAAPHVLQALLLAALIKNENKSKLRKSPLAARFRSFWVVGVIAPGLSALSALAFMLLYSDQPLLNQMLLWFIASACGQVTLVPLLQEHMEAQKTSVFSIDLLVFSAFSILVTLTSLFFLSTPFPVLAMPLALAALRLDAFPVKILIAANTLLAALLLQNTSLAVTQHAGYHAADGYIALALINAGILILIALHASQKHHRRVAQDARQQSRAIMELSTLPTAMLDMNGIFLQSNTAFQSLLGYTSAMLHSLSFKDISHPLDLAKNMANHQEVLAGRVNAFSTEKRYIHQTGQIIHARLNLTLVKDSAGQPLYFLAQLEDRTKLVEQTARQQQELLRYRQALLGSGLGIWQWQLDNQQMDCDDEWRRSFPGQAFPKKVSQAQFLSRIHPNDRDAVGISLNKLMNGTQSQIQATFRRRNDQGDYAWIHTHAVRLISESTGEDQTAAHVTLIGIDRCYNLEMKLTYKNDQLNRRNRLLGKVANAGIWLWDTVSGSLQWDDRMFDIYHYPRSDSSKMFDAWQRRLHPDDRAGVIAEIADVLGREKPLDMMFRISLDNGDVRYIRSIGYLYEQSDTGAQCVIGVNWDVTDARQRQHKLDQAQLLFETTAEQLALPFILVDQEETIRFCNPAALALINWSLKDARGMPFASLFNLWVTSQDGKHYQLTHPFAKADNKDLRCQLGSSGDTFLIRFKQITPEAGEPGKLLILLLPAH